MSPARFLCCLFYSWLFPDKRFLLNSQQLLTVATLWFSQGPWLPLHKKYWSEEIITWVCMALSVLDTMLFVFKNWNQTFAALQLRYVLALIHDHNKTFPLHFTSCVWVSVTLQCSWTECEQKGSGQDLWSAPFWVGHSSNAHLAYVQVDFPVSWFLFPVSWREWFLCLTNQGFLLL